MSHAVCRAIQDGQVIEESFNKAWATGGGNGKPLQYSYHENPMSSMKRQKDATIKDGSPGQKTFDMLPGKSRRQLLVSTEKMKWLDQSRNDAQFCMCLMVKVKPKCCKEQYYVRTWNVRFLNQ